MAAILCLARSIVGGYTPDCSSYQRLGARSKRNFCARPAKSEIQRFACGNGASYSGKTQAIYLTAYCDEKGETVPYSIDWDGKTKSLIVVTQNGKEQLTLNNAPFFLMPLPIRVDGSMALYFIPNKQNSRCEIYVNHPLLSKAENLLIDKTKNQFRYKLYLILLLSIWLFGDWHGKLGFLTLAIFAIAPLIISRLLLFLPALLKNIRSLFEFAVLVIRHRIFK